MKKTEHTINQVDYHARLMKINGKRRPDDGDQEGEFMEGLNEGKDKEQDKHKINSKKKMDLSILSNSYILLNAYDQLINRE